MTKLHNPVLVIDDEADIRDLMELTLMKMGLSVETAVGVEDAKNKLSNNDYSLILTDMRMPDGSGLEVVQYLDKLAIDTPIAVITAYGNADHAVEALKAGAFDYLQKPITLSQLRSLVKSAVSVNDDAPPVAPPPQADNRPRPVVPLDAVVQTASPVSKLQVKREKVPFGTMPDSLRNLKDKFSVPDSGDLPEAAPLLPDDPEVPRLLGKSQQIEEVRHLIRRLARSDVPVYISGESGSGKEQAARSIHELSARQNAPFVAVNCGAIPENLMESEFFGYTKGSFTGANTDKAGFFQYADGGTLFLDEVADLPLVMQVKLLRAIQEKAVRRLGDAYETPVDVRIICATHKNLAQLVATGQFRQDLYYRLNVVSLAMPPLREMRQDLAPLIMRLLARHNHQRHIFQLSPKAQEALLQYSYPGNFRELENILERAVALSVGNVIQVDDLQIHAMNLDKLAPQVANQAARVEVAQPLSEDGFEGFDPNSMQIQDYLDSIERRIIEAALKQTGNNRTQAAKLLGISFRSMRYRMERLDVR